MTGDDVATCMAKAVLLGGERSGQTRIRFLGQECYPVKKQDREDDYWFCLNGTLYNKPQKVERRLIALITMYRKRWERQNA